MAKLCMGCMNPLPKDSDTCAVCGYNPEVDHNPEHCLPAAAVLQDHYIVGRFLSEGSDHLLYIGYDRQLKEPCFIQEFYSGSISRRDTIGGVQPLSGCERVFEEYADQFRNSMRALARMRELPSIIPVYDIFEENGTVYAVSDYCEGMTLAKKIKLDGGRLPWSEARPLFMSLMSSVIRLNETGIYHLGICPQNILVGKDGKARLRGFAINAARRAGTDLTPQLESGYAAPEQYMMDGEVGQAADVYGMAATIFRAVTGNEPPAGNARSKTSDDLFMSAEVAEELSQQVCVALFNALQVSPESRTATLAELRDQISTEPTVTALKDEAAKEDQLDAAEDPQANRKKKNTKLIWIFTGCLAVLLLVVVLFMTFVKGAWRQKDGEDSSSEALPTLTTTQPIAHGDQDKQVSVDNLVGKDYYALRDATLSGQMTIKLDYVVYSSKKAGTILSQFPKEGTAVDKGTEIKVVISNGRKDEKLKVPDVSGWKEEHARLYLEALGFRVEVVQLQASTFDKGLVDSTDPAVGTEKRVGDVITLRVSNVETTTTTATTTDATTTENSEGGWWPGIFG